MDRLNPWIIGAALAITFAVVYVLCAAAFAVAPGATLGFFNAWFHGLNLAELQTGAKPFTIGVFVYGLVGVTGFGFVCGILIATSYNLLRH
jgi:hypothetical protein